ncbi:MAG: hypothetical protein IIA88_07085, partial [Bacteroidetes bacterium]|nr:hypothetical protein [Bacteroidota bacterium]
MTNLQKRIIVGIIGAALIIFSIWFSAWTYFALFFLICSFSQLEFYKNVAAGRICNPALYVGLICGLTLFSSTFLIEKEIISSNYYYLLFPIFSLILGDLHPHVMNLPFVILGLGLCLNLFLSTERLGLRWLRDHPVESAAIALFIGSLAFINIWDLPVIAAMLVAVALVKAYGDRGGNLTGAALDAAVIIVPILALAVVLFLPFYSGFEAQTSGILPLRDVNTRPFLLFLV